MRAYDMSVDVHSRSRQIKFAHGSCESVLLELSNLFDLFEFLFASRACAAWSDARYMLCGVSIAVEE